MTRTPAQKGRYSRNKGCVGERQAAALLRKLGFPKAKRTAQHKGTTDSSDVDGIDGVFIETKYLVKGLWFGTRKMELAQHRLIADCPKDRAPVMLWKPHGSQTWLVTFETDDAEWLTTDNVLYGIRFAQSSRRRSVGFFPQGPSSPAPARAE